MAYLALYRAWRPQTFGQVVGQEKIVTALHNAVREKRLAHALLLAGPRGTGKTSIAKIVAKALNCLNPEDGEPCNQCSNCIDINNGNFMDVIEIDAASNRGIDEIRDLREKVRILPAQGKYKIYIIDEVHMLTTEAFNALLKTIEEPPAAVIFILATTEPQRIPATIRSRCQSYSFRSLTAQEIKGRLREVALAKDIVLDEDAAVVIARRANGGLRDGLSILDQLFAYKGQHITKPDVIDILGIVDQNSLVNLMEAIIAADMAWVLGLIHSILNEGKDAMQIAREMSLYLRDLLLYVNDVDSVDFYIVDEEIKPILAGQKASIDKSRIVKALHQTMDLTNRLKFSEGQKFILEMGFLDLITTFKPLIETAPPVVEVESSAKTMATPPKNRGEKADARKVLWSKILAAVKEQNIPTHALLSQGILLGSKDEVVYIGFKKGYKFHKERMEEKPNREMVEKVVEELFGKKAEIQFVFLDDDQYNNIIVKKAIEYFGEDIVDIKD